MTAAEARERISQEAIKGFQEWLKDEAELSGDEYAEKYSYLKSDVNHEDEIESFETYVKYFTLEANDGVWESYGYPKEVITELHADGFLSSVRYRRARHLGMDRVYFISKETAREIYERSKAF